MWTLPCGEGGPAWRLQPCSISLHPAQAWGGVMQAESWGSPRRGASAPRVPAPELQEEEVASLPRVQAEEGLRRGEGTTSRLSQGLGPLPRESVLGRAITGPHKRPAFPYGWLQQLQEPPQQSCLPHRRPSPTSHTCCPPRRPPQYGRPPGESRSQSLSSPLPGHGDLPGPRDERKGT